MKKLLLTLLIVSLATTMWANNRNHSELRISLSDGSAFSIKVGNVMFNNQSTSYSIKNLAPGEHFIEIVKKEGFRDRRGRWIVTNSVVFADYIKLRASTILVAEINHRGRLVVTDEFALYGRSRDNRYESIRGNSRHNRSHRMDSYNGHWSSNGYNTMNHNAFAALLNTLSNSNFDSDKVEIAKQALAWNRVTAMQIRQIISVFSFESSKLEIAKFAFNSTADPENYFIVHDAFSFSSSSRELYSYIVASH